MTRVVCPRAYAWQLEEGELCRWAEPNRGQLRMRTAVRKRVGSQPSPGARIVGVHLVPVGRYRELLVAERRLAQMEESRRRKAEGAG